MPYHSISAAFRSSKLNECYIFVKEKYVVLNYAPGAKKKDVISGPINISNGFPVLAEMSFANEIDCAFDADGHDVFIFSGNYSAKISTDGSLLIGQISILAMFPCLKKTAFKDGIDAAIRSTEKYVFLFKGDEYIRMEYQTEDITPPKSIGDGFRSLVGTVFEFGIDAAFSSHVKDEAYIFKGEYYARFNFSPEKSDGDFIVDGRIKLINEDWPALYDILHYYN